jgi:hypothetical protein
MPSPPRPRAGGIPVGRPFPDVADHVVNSIAVRRERRHRRRALIAVEGQVLARERALPGVRHLPIARRELIAPCELGAVEAAAGGELPFGFGGQFLAGPFGIGHGILVGDVDDGMIVEPADRASRSVWAPPIGAELERPPLAPVAQIDRRLGRREDQRARLEHVRQRAGIVPGVGRNFGKGDVARRVDEFAELAIGDRRTVHPEAAHAHPVDRGLFRIVPVGTHAECTARNPHHALAQFGGRVCSTRVGLRLQHPTLERRMRGGS